MAQSISFYNHTRKLFANGEVDISQLKVQLRNGTSFVPETEGVDTLDGAEVSGNGWTEGGEPIDSATITVTATDEATLDGDDISVLAAEGDIGPADSAIIIDDSATPAIPLWYIEFTGAETAGDGTNFNINWHAEGIARWNSPA